jgi:Domain of unknown function (DUF4129)
MTPVEDGANPDKARELAQEILRQKRFQQPKPSRAAKQPFSWIMHRIGRFFHWLSLDATGGVGVWFWPIVAGIAVLIATVLIVRTIRLRGRMSRDPKIAARIAHESSAELQRRAESASKSGDFLSSVRLRFRAGLAALDERGVLLGSDHRTNRMIAASLGDAAPPFREVANVFDELRYGGLVPSRSHDDDARRLWTDILIRSPKPEAHR